MHTSRPCTAPSLPHRYTLRLCLILCYLAHLHMPFLSTSHSCGCIKEEVGERDTKTPHDAHTICRLKRFHSRGLRCLSAVLSCVGEKERSPLSSSPARSCWAEETPQRSKAEQKMEKKKGEETLKEWRSRIGAEVNGEDKEVVGGWGEKRDRRMHDKKRKK